MAQAKRNKGTPVAQAPKTSAAMMAFTPNAVVAWREIMQESARFLNERLQQDLATQRAMLDCKTPADLLRVQTEFYETAVAQYTEETTRLLNMMTKGAGTARSYDDVPL